MAIKKKAASKKKVVAKKSTTKKSAVKKSIVKKSVSKKSAVKKKLSAKKAPVKNAQNTTAARKPKTTAIQNKMTKSQILNEISENTDISKKDVASVLSELDLLIERHIKKRACGEFLLPGLLKIVTVKKPAVKARKGTNPFTGEEMMFKAKKATTVVKVRALKKLKEMAL